MLVTTGYLQSVVMGPLGFMIHMILITVRMAGCWVAFAESFTVCVCLGTQKNSQVGNCRLMKVFQIISMNLQILHAEVNNIEI